MNNEQIKLALEKMCEVVGGKSRTECVSVTLQSGRRTVWFSHLRDDFENAPAIQVLFDAIANEERRVAYIVKESLEIGVYDGANTAFFKSRKPGLSLTERVLDVMYQWSVTG